METKPVPVKVAIENRRYRSFAMIVWLIVVFLFSIAYLITRDDGEFTWWSVSCLAVLVAFILYAGFSYARDTKPEDPDQENSESKHRVAVLIVHGMGVQDKYQMLDDFARSLPVFTEKFAKKVTLQVGAAKNEYLPLLVCDKQVDVHEAFWGLFFNRLATLPKTLIFGAWTLGKFAPNLFSRFGRKRWAEALCVGVALFLVYAFISSIHSGLVLSSRRFEAIKNEKWKDNKLTTAEAEDIGLGRFDAHELTDLAPSLKDQTEVDRVKGPQGTKRPSKSEVQRAVEESRQPTWLERVTMTSEFTWLSIKRGLSRNAWEKVISFERPLKLLNESPKVRLLFGVLYCVSFGLIILKVCQVVSAQYKFWTAGSRGPQDNPAYEKAINDKWVKDSWGAIKSGILPLAGILVFDPILDPILVHLLATFAVLVIVLKGLSWWLTNFLGDVMIYATLNANSETYEAREKATELVATKTRSLLDDSRYERVVVVAHSLGSVVAANAVRRVCNNGHKEIKKLGAFVTIGSPLRKFRQLFKAQPYLWAFGDNAVSQDDTIFIGDDFLHKERLPWFNYWYGSDLFADRLAYQPLRKLKKDVNRAVAKGSQIAYDAAVRRTRKRRSNQLDTTGFRVGDRRDCNLGPRVKLWSHSDYWLDHRFVDDLLQMTQCDDTELKEMSVALKPTIDANKRP